MRGGGIQECIHNGPDRLLVCDWVLTSLDWVPKCATEHSASGLVFQVWRQRFAFNHQTSLHYANIHTSY